MQQIVEKEIEVYRQEYGDEKALNQYLGNFYSNLPTDDAKNMSYNRNVAAFLGVLDKTREGYDAQGSKDGSELWRKQTFRQFFKTIDTVLEEVGISIEEIKRLQDLIKGLRKDNDGRDPLDKLNELVLPAYVKLMERGYNRYPDLVR